MGGTTFRVVIRVLWWVAWIAFAVVVGLVLGYVALIVLAMIAMALYG